MNGNMQKPYSNNQVKNDKPSVPMSRGNILTGHFQGSMNGGHNKTQTYFYVMANQYIDKLMLQEKIRLLTPFTPPYMKLFCTFRVYNVPHSAVWKDYEEFFGQKGGTSIEKIKEIPNLGGQNIPTIRIGANPQGSALYTDTAAWRDHIFSPYLPRTGDGKIYNSDIEIKFPKVSILGMRGRIKIYNMFERNKEFDEELLVYDDDNILDVYNHISNLKNQIEVEKYLGRAKNNNNYYSDFRTELQGLEASYPPADMSADMSLENWMANFENLIAESRSEAENANLNENELIAKLRGSQLLTEGRVTKIAEKTIPLNYSSITQTNYNNIANEKAQATGTQGAYSYTEVNIPILEKIKFKEDGIVHIIATVWAEKIYESSYDRMDLNVNALDLYRPDMLEAKKDIMYRAEIDNTILLDDKNNTKDYYQTLGFKRKYNEYFKLRNTIFGDLTSNPYYNYDDKKEGELKYDAIKFDQIDINNIILTNNTYQFNLIGGMTNYDADSNNYMSLNYWQDYTDILINKNLAYKEPVYNGPDTDAAGDDNGKYYIIITGQNQIDFVGNLTMLCDLPVDDSIRTNWTEWGEH